jgi:chromosome segregation ATPase
MAMNHILMKLSADLRDVSSGLGAHAKYLDELQQWSSEADETIKRERLQKAAFEDQLQKLQEALRKEWEMRVHAEDQLKAANERIGHLEEKIKRGFQAYEALSQENMRLSSALQLARNSTTMTAEELREQKARRERLENMLHEAKRRNMSEEDIIKMLENALIDETDKEFVGLLKNQIEERKKLLQEHMDVYLAYRLQHGELAEEEKRKKKQQEDQDLAFARQLQSQENSGRVAAKPAAAAAPRAYPYAAYQVNPYQNQYIYTYPTTASTTSPARPAQPQKKGGGYQKF